MQLDERLKAAQAHGYDSIPEMPDGSMVEKPKHYQNRNGKDLFQKWYEQHDIATFRHIMLDVAITKANYVEVTG